MEVADVMNGRTWSSIMKKTYMAMPGSPIINMTIGATKMRDLPLKVMFRVRFCGRSESWVASCHERKNADAGSGWAEHPGQSWPGLKVALYCGVTPVIKSPYVSSIVRLTRIACANRAYTRRRSTNMRSSCVRRVHERREARGEARERYCPRLLDVCMLCKLKLTVGLMYQRIIVCSSQMCIDTELLEAGSC